MVYKNNPLSFSSVKLDLFSKEGARLKPASGFMIESGNRSYLVTSRRVLAGISAEEQQELVSKPYTLKTSLHIREGDGEKTAPLFMGMRKRLTIELYDDHDTPKWMELLADEQYQSPIDIVGLPIPADLTFAIRLGQEIPGMDINKNYWTRISAIPISAIDTDIDYGPPDTVHIVGYPIGWAPAGTDKSSAAFWRTSWIASEINEPGSTHAHGFFIDPCAPEGMNGAPVIGLKNDRMKLLGVYSDLPSAEFGVNAGFVWEARVIKQLINAS